MIKKLENKYFVLKRDDVYKYLSPVEFFKLDSILDKIYAGRMKDDKDHWNHYVVLNLDDEINIKYLISELQDIDREIVNVNQIAVLLINSILNVGKVDQNDKIKITNDKLNELLKFVRNEYYHGCNGMRCEDCVFKNYEEDYTIHLLCDLMRHFGSEDK